MLVLITVSFLCALWFAALTFAARVTLPVHTWLLGFQIVFQYVLVEFDIGPVSIRIYCLALLAAWILARVLSRRGKLFTSASARNIFLIYCAYMAWIFIASSATHRFSEDVAYKLLSTHLYGVLFFIALQHFPRSYVETRFLVQVMLGVVVVNALVALLQWFGVGFSWYLFEVLRPSSLEMREEALDMQGTTLGYAPGLQEYSIPLSFVLLFGLVPWGSLLVYLRNVGLGRLFWWASLFLICEAGIIASLSRSSLLAFNAVVLFSFLWLRKPLVLSGRGLAIGMTLITLLCFVFFVQLPSNELDSYEGYTTSRLFRFATSGREDLWEIAIELIQDFPLYGAGLQEFVSRLGAPSAPHNFLLNAGVYYGMPAMLIMLIFTIYLVLFCRRSLQLWLPYRFSMPHTLGIMLVLIAYLFKSFFHNDSFATGGILGWLALGLICADRGIIENTKPT